MESPKKKRKYAPDALRKGAPLYENAPVYFDHQPIDEVIKGVGRKFVDRFGTFKNVRFVEGDGLRGDLHYNANHPYANTVRGWLTSEGEGPGFSHDAYVTFIREGDTEVGTEIVSVRSVDLVASSATTLNIRESTFEMEPLEMPGPGNASADFLTKLGELVHSVMIDESLDAGGKKAKILKLLKLMDDDKPAADVKEEDKPADDDKPEDKKVEEGNVNPLDTLVAKLSNAVIARVVESLTGSATLPTVSPPAKVVKSEPVTKVPTPVVKPSLTVDAFMLGLVQENAN